MKTTVRLSALLALAIFAWYLVADRITPFTSNVRMKAVVIDIVPQVSGYVAAVAVSNGQVVERGDLLVRIDRRPYQFEAEQARSALEIATQDVGAGSAGIELALANLALAENSLENTRLQTARTLELESKGIVSGAAGDNARALLEGAQSALVAAEADLERARRQLGVEGEENAQIRSAVAALGEAELALEWTELRAPARGVVIDPQVAVGTYARAGSTVLTFLSFEEVWVEAYMKENNIANVAIGDPAEISLDLYPGRIFEGVVSSITFGASDGARDDGLPGVPKVSGWMRDPQRFPVRIAMPGYEVGSETADVRRMLNGQADVIVYTSDNAIMNALGAAWMRLMSVISYAY
jgi:multidrug resistance efflux pump